LHSACLSCSGPVMMFSYTTAQLNGIGDLRGLISIIVAGSNSTD
jgi:hypothetical protein